MDYAVCDILKLYSLYFVIVDGDPPFGSLIPWINNWKIFQLPPSQDVVKIHQSNMLQVINTEMLFCKNIDKILIGLSCTCMYMTVHCYLISFFLESCVLPVSPSTLNVKRGCDLPSPPMSRAPCTADRNARRVCFRE